MTKNRQVQYTQAAISLICMIVVWLFTAPWDGTEFSGGRVTGLLLHMANLAIVFFVIAGVLAFVRGVLGGAACLIGCLLAFPIYFYFVLPGPFRSLIRGEYSVPLRSSVAFTFSSALGMFALTLATFFSVRVLLSRRIPKQTLG